MEITRNDITTASQANAEKYVDAFRMVAESAFAEGAEWALDLIKQKVVVL